MKKTFNVTVIWANGTERDRVIYADTFKEAVEIAQENIVWSQDEEDDNDVIEEVIFWSVDNHALCSVRLHCISYHTIVDLKKEGII